jgi:hypothetical protein
VTDPRALARDKVVAAQEAFNATLKLPGVAPLALAYIASGEPAEGFVPRLDDAIEEAGETVAGYNLNKARQALEDLVLASAELAIAEEAG